MSVCTSTSLSSASPLAPTHCTLLLSNLAKPLSHLINIMDDYSTIMANFDRFWDIIEDAWAATYDSPGMNVYIRGTRPHIWLATGLAEVRMDGEDQRVMYRVKALLPQVCANLCAILSRTDLATVRTFEHHFDTLGRTLPDELNFDAKAFVMATGQTYFSYVMENEAIVYAEATCPDFFRAIWNAHRALNA